MSGYEACKQMIYSNIVEGGVCSLSKRQVLWAHTTVSLAKALKQARDKDFAHCKTGGTSMADSATCFSPSLIVLKVRVIQ